MEIKNFAHFGLFCKGILLISGSMEEMIEEANKCMKNNENASCTISSIAFSKRNGNTNIVEGTKILKYTNINSVIYVINELL